MKVACSASLLGYHFLNHSGLLDFLLREEKGMCKINVSRSLVSTSTMGCKVHLCHSPSSLWRWKIFFSLYWFAGKPVYFAIRHQFWCFLLFLLFLSPCDVTVQKNNIVSLRHCGENLSGPWVFAHINFFAILQGSARYHHEAFDPTRFTS